MPAFGEMIVIYDLLPEMAEKLAKALDEAVKKAAFDIQAAAQAAAPVDTGFLKNSIYVETHSESTYGQIAEPTSPTATVLPEVEKPKEHQAVVAVGANYGVYVEFGTVHGPAQPYLTPAAAIVEPQFIAALTKMEDLMAAV